MKAITANRLYDGRVVYIATHGEWTEAIAEAAMFTDEAAADEALRAAQADSLTAVGAYLIDLEAGAPAGRKRIREGIRGRGPTAGSLHLHTRAQRYGVDQVAAE